MTQPQPPISREGKNPHITPGYRPNHMGLTMRETVIQGLIFGFIITCMFSGVLVVLTCIASIII